MAIVPLTFDKPDGFVTPASFGRPSHLGFVAIESLRIDLSYQRDVDDAGRAHVLAIARAFDWSRFGAILVAPAGEGAYAIIDGQHRTLAALICGIQKVPCVVIFADARHQAAAFAAVNGTVKPVSIMNVYRAAKAAGEPWALTADSIVASAGCRLMDTNASTAFKKPGEVYCVGFFRELALDGAHTPLARAAVTALRALKMADSAAKAEAWTAQPVQGLSHAIAQAGLQAVDPRTIAALLDRVGFLDVCNAARLTVAQRRKQGLPTASLTVQLTEDLVDLLAGAA